MTSLTTPAAEPAADRSTEDRAARIERLRAAAYRIRLNALNMGEVQGQGYIGQALGVADVLAVAYTDRCDHRPEDPHWEGRDRFLLSIGHYAIALYAALAEAGIIPVEELETYGSDESPAADVGHGLLHPRHGDLRRLTRPRPHRRHRDGARAAPPGQPRPHLQPALRRRARRRLHLGGGHAVAHHGLDNVTAIVDVNALQADGPTEGILRTEPVTDKWQAFGWHAIRVDGNDIDALVDAFDEAPRPHRLALGARSATPASDAGCRCWKPGRRRTSCASAPRNGRSPATSSQEGFTADDHRHRPPRRPGRLLPTHRRRRRRSGSPPRR